MAQADAGACRRSEVGGGGNPRSRGEESNGVAVQDTPMRETGTEEVTVTRGGRYSDMYDPLAGTQDADTGVE